jgi:general secretion pathway protein G
MNSRRRTRRGFTLIEILLVLGIIVMLASVTGFAMWNAAKGAKVDVAKTQMKGKLIPAIGTYYANVGHYPTEEEGGLKALLTRPAFSDEKLSAVWRGPYITDSDLTDPWGNPWAYELNTQTGTTTSDQEPFKLHSNGPNLQAGDDDDVQNWSDKTGTP